MGRDFDFVFTNKPANKTAAAVLSQSGEHYDPDCVMNEFHSETPLPIEDFIGPEKDNLTGRKVGRMTVIGFLRKETVKRSGLWLVRCTCGHYETRRSHSIKNERNTNDMCRNCRNWEFHKNDTPQKRKISNKKNRQRRARRRREYYEFLNKNLI